MSLFFKSAMLAVLATSALAAHATSTSLAADGQWRAFGVDTFSAISGGTEWIDNADSTAAGYGSALTFDFTVAAGFVAQLTVVDTSMAGDVFQVFDHGNLLGMTSSVPLQSYGSAPDVGYDHDAALLNSDFSRGVFTLGAGTYSISGVLAQSLMLDDGAGGLSPLNATAGGIKLSVSAVPEPAALVLAGLGLGWLAVRRSVSRSARRTLCAAVALAFSTGAMAQATAPKPPFSVKIIGFNDYHGNLESPGTFGVNTLVPTASRPLVGGAEYMAAYVARMKAANPLNVVVGAGDFIGATPLISALFFDEPAVETLNKMGVEFNAVGNHEFDKGKDELKRLQNGGCRFNGAIQEPNSCKGFGSAAPGGFDGARFKWLSANVVETATGKPLLPAYGVKTFNGVKVAFIGMTLKGTPGIVTPTGVAGLTFQDEADTANALIPRLRAQGIEAIVVLLHQGGFQNQVTGLANQPITSDINGCTGDLKNADGTDSDVRAIVKRLDNAVDLVISGHTHSAYNCSANTIDVRGTSLASAVTTARAAGVPNKAGRLVPVTSASAFGRVLTEVDVSIDPTTRDVVAVSPRNVLVDRTDPGINNAIAAHPEVKDVVSAYKAAASPLANAVIATITAPMTNAANAAGEMEAGDLIADAQLAATQPANLGGAVIAFMNAGGVRNPGFLSAGGTYPYDLTYGDAFTTQPFGNSLVTLTLTAQQIKDVLEQQFSGCNGQTATRIMQVSNGLKYTWHSAGGCGSRITEVALTPTDVTVTPAVVTGPTEMLVVGGVVQNPTKTYRVTVNNFMATGGDGFGVLLGGKAQLGGAQDIDALTAYLTGFKSAGLPYNPASPALAKPRITRQ